MSGWIKLHRKLLESPIFDNTELLRVWIWCLIKASHKEHQQMVGLQVIELKPGQFVTGRFKGSSELKLNPSTFYKYLKTLEKLQMIDLNSNNKMTVVTIEKWGEYQSDEEQSYQQRINNVSTTYQQRNTNKNDKNVKNDKKDRYILSDDENKFLNTLEEIENYPLDRKKDLEMYKTLEEKYPTLNLVEAIEQWRIYKLDQPLKAKSNPRSQINTAFKKYVDWGKCLKNTNSSNFRTDSNPSSWRGSDKRL